MRLICYARRSIEQSNVQLLECRNVILHRVNLGNSIVKRLPKVWGTCRPMDCPGQADRIGDAKMQSIDAIRDLLGHAADVAADHGPPGSKRLLDDQRRVLPPG